MFNKFMIDAIDLEHWLCFASDCELLSTYADDWSMWFAGGEL